MPQLESLHTYPIKSGAPLHHETIAVEARGLAGDRRYMLIGSDGRFLTGRELPELVLVAPIERPQGLALRAPGMTDLEIARPCAGERVGVRVWKDETTARAVGAGADAWFSRYLGRDCRLVYQHDDDLRVARTPRGDASRDPVSFADGYPQLLIGSASLEDLNARLDSPVAMGRFRPNLVVTTDTPFVEDAWRKLRIGDCEFEVVKRCARCVFTTIDPLSGHPHPDGEPLRTLRGYRLDRSSRGVMFGVNLIPRRLGRLERGMPVELLE